MSNSSQLPSPVGLPPENDGEQETSEQPGLKRKCLLQERDGRKKVSRACDQCKAKKVRCSGRQPCNRCTSQSLSCGYNAEHRRGRPATPEPGLPINSFDQGTTNLHLTPSSEDLNHKQNSARPTLGAPTFHEPRKSSRSSQEADEIRFEGNYIGPTSGIAFLHRARRRFQQDFAGTTSSSFNGQGSMHAPILSFGDGWASDYSASEFVFPSSDEARRLLDRYFDFAMPTYRFLHRATVEQWLGNMCDERQNPATQRQPTSSAKGAIVLLTLATAKLFGEDAAGLLHGESKDSEASGILFSEANRRLSKETGPVRLESVQARLAQCIYLLASSRINQAWYTFGTATQMILALGLHRKRYSQPSGSTSWSTPELIEIECRKRVFWSAYTLDRYLSVILGRPRIFRDEDVDQHLPDRLNDADLTTTRAKAKSVYNQCVLDGPVFHAKLAKIIGGISSDLYPTKSTAGAKWIDSAKRWTVELKAWKESLPAFLEPTKVDPSILVPIFQRQSTVLRLAYAHALILANRPSLLNNFADLSRPQSLPQEELRGSLKECIDAAVLVVDTVNGFIEEDKMCNCFWFTHYISFCAIAAIYVYTIQQSMPHQTSSPQLINDVPLPCSTKHFEAAKRCQRGIAETTAKTSPFSRYNIILDELKSEVLRRLGQTCASQASVNIVTTGQGLEENERSHQFMNSSGGTPLRTPSNTGTSRLEFEGSSDGSLYLQNVEPLLAQGYTLENNDLEFRAAGNNDGQIFDDAMLNLALFGPQGEFIGWSELDSCAITWPDGYDMFEQGVELQSRSDF